MSTDTTNAASRNSWIIALLVSMALNGLLIGLLLSKQVQPKTGNPAIPPTRTTMQAMPNNPRHLVRTLSPERRKQVMATAMKSLKSEGKERPRRLFKQLRHAKLKTMGLMSADDMDAEAIEKSLADIREINQKLAISGDALMVEVLGQLTLEERQQAREALRKRKMRHRKPERRRPN